MTTLLDMVDVRLVGDEDLNFVRSSWLRNYRGMCEWAPREQFFALHHDVVEGLLARSSCLVAVVKDDPAHIIGWVCGEDGAAPVIHYAYVKRAYRSQGVARLLCAALLGDRLRHGGISVSHTTTPSVAGKLRAANWAIRPTMAFYLGLQAQGVREAA